MAEAEEQLVNQLAFGTKLGRHAFSVALSSFSRNEMVSMAQGHYTPGQCQVLSYAHLHAETGEWFFLPRRKVMAFTGMSERSFDRAVQGLREKGVLEARHQRGKPASYRFTADRDNVNTNDTTSMRMADMPAEEIVSAADVWARWQTACRRQDRRAVIDAREMRAASTLAAHIERGTLSRLEMERCMHDFLVDDDPRLGSQGYPLALLMKRLRKYLNVAIEQPALPAPGLIDEAERAAREEGANAEEVADGNA